MYILVEMKITEVNFQQQLYINTKSKKNNYLFIEIMSGKKQKFILLIILLIFLILNDN